MIHPSLVPCPRCGADVGESCVSPNTDHHVEPHRARLAAARAAAAVVDEPRSEDNSTSSEFITTDSPCYRCGALHDPADGCGLSEDDDATYAAWEAMPDDAAARLDTARHILKSPEAFDPALVHVAEVAVADLDEGAQPGLRLRDENAPTYAEAAQAAVAATRANGLPPQPSVAAAEARELATPDSAETNPTPYFGWRGEHDPAGESHALPCPTCAAPAGTPCGIEPGYEYLYKDEPWPPGYVHTARAAHHAEALYVSHLRETHAEAALLERCPHPDCQAPSGVPCSGDGVHDGRLCLALTRAGERSAARNLAHALLNELHPFRAYSCSVCGAPGNESCRTRSGKHCMDHDEKRDAWIGARAWLDNAITAVEAEVYACVECHDEGTPWCACATVPFPDHDPLSWTWTCSKCGSALPHNVDLCDAGPPDAPTPACPRCRWAVPHKPKSKECDAFLARGAPTHGPEFSTCPVTGRGWTHCPACVGAHKAEPGTPGYHSETAIAARIAANPALAAPCPECFAHAGQECRLNADGKYLTCRARKTAETTAPSESLFGAALPPPVVKPITTSPPAATAPEPPPSPAPAPPPAPAPRTPGRGRTQLALF